MPFIVSTHRWQARLESKRRQARAAGAGLALHHCYLPAHLAPQRNQPEHQGQHLKCQMWLKHHPQQMPHPPQIQQQRHRQVSADHLQQERRPS